MKIRYRLVFDRKHDGERRGSALVQIEARKDGRKAYFSTGVYVRTDQWDGTVAGHPNAADLNAYLTDQIMKLEAIELDLWKHGIEPTLTTSERVTGQSPS